MKVGSKGFYGLLALTDLAEHHKQPEPVQVREIARRQKIPEEYLGQIMVLMKRANLVHGTRGPSGGYHLARSPETITVREVLRVLEGPPVGINLKGQRNLWVSSSTARRILDAWGRAAEASEKILAEVTLADLCGPEERPRMYYI
jgi:Rrf2 family transcriptional regulator, cysteine metabolism repressor